MKCFKQYNVHATDVINYFSFVEVVFEFGSEWVLHVSFRVNFVGN